jgi:hypothetical protein
MGPIVLGLQVWVRLCWARFSFGDSDLVRNGHSVLLFGLGVWILSCSNGCADGICVFSLGFYPSPRLSNIRHLRIQLFTSASILSRPHQSTLQVGDGLEIYVILAPGRAPGELLNIAGLSEVTTETAAGERVFVIRRELKKD